MTGVVITARSKRRLRNSGFDTRRSTRFLHRPALPQSRCKPRLKTDDNEFSKSIFPRGNQRYGLALLEVD